MIKEKSRRAEAAESEKNKDSGRNRLILRRNQPEKQQDKERIKIVIETAATLSHEINNPLMVIMASIESILKSNSNLSDDIVEKLEIISSSAGRIKDVTEKLARASSLTYRETACGRMINLNDSLD